MAKAPNACQGASCTKAAHSSCLNSCCRNCCVGVQFHAGKGCSITSHTFTSLLAHQQNKITSQRPSLPSNQASSSLPSTTRNLELEPPHVPLRVPDLLPFVLGNPNNKTTFEEFAKSFEEDNPLLLLQQDSALREEEERLERQHEEQEAVDDEREYQQMLAETRAALRAASSSPSSEAMVSTSQPDANPPPLVIAGIPVTKVASMKKTPTITHHLNADWMRLYEDKSKLQPQPTGNGQLDPELIQKFRNDNEPVVFTVLECPNWPKWKINDSPTTKKHLGPILLQFYDIDTAIWVEVPTSYPFTLKTDSYLLLRHAGIKCLCFDEQLAVALRKPDNQRTYISNVRRPLKKSSAKSQSTQSTPAPADEGSDDEVEVIEYTGTSLAADQKGKKRRREPSLLSSPGTSSFNPISVPNSPLSLPTLLSSGSRTISPTPAPVITHSKGPLPSIPGHAGPWPKNMYVCDMTEGFQRMKKLMKSTGANYHDRFCDVFGQPPPKDNTYYDQVWRTPAGQWSRFSALIPLRQN
ncbi:hypothetical protein NLJ89_g11196 [Agrocybe chaxingu]|uniref:Uncharacterized protein n=1 Tax=Agrocybe chaxingu TaxID=84603 RepID=A0A9W8JPT9_9AGAR|nr:hypothetical protein NLJ89_g11196 [Agrocybe chaxingu]